jgi:hypothetical protein
MFAGEGGMKGHGAGGMERGRETEFPNFRISRFSNQPNPVRDALEEELRRDDRRKNVQFVCLLLLFAVMGIFLMLVWHVSGLV